jgi:hypothetical protein
MTSIHDTHAPTPPQLRDLTLRARPSLKHLVCARLRGASLDRQLASGTPSWHSPTHAARALQLTNDRNRRALIHALERLVKDAEHPAWQWGTAAVAPCREQVREALEVIRAITSRLRAVAPVDPGAMAALTVLLSDGAGPCYIPMHPGALKTAIEPIADCLDVRD